MKKYRVSPDQIGYINKRTRRPQAGAIDQYITDMHETVDMLQNLLDSEPRVMKAWIELLDAQTTHEANRKDPNRKWWPLIDAELKLEKVIAAEGSEILVKRLGF